MTEPVIARKASCAVAVEAGETYWWCACGRSADQPWCDGSHAGTGLGPMKYVAEKTGTVYFCGCKKTARPPLCDGTHNTL